MSNEGKEGEVWAESMLDIFLGSDLVGGLCVGHDSLLCHSNKHSPNLSGSKQEVYYSPNTSIARRFCSKLHCLSSSSCTSSSRPPLSRMLSISKAGEEKLAGHAVALKGFQLHVIGKSKSPAIWGCTVRSYLEGGAWEMLGYRGHDYRALTLVWNPLILYPYMIC